MKALGRVTVHVHRVAELEGATVTNATTGERRPAVEHVDTGETFTAMAYESDGRVAVKHDGEWYELKHCCGYHIVKS